ncbi:hypothetical protein FKM82_028146 [Ascaphus truei]
MRCCRMRSVGSRPGSPRDASPSQRPPKRNRLLTQQTTNWSNPLILYLPPILHLPSNLIPNAAPPPRIAPRSPKLHLPPEHCNSLQTLKLPHTAAPPYCSSPQYCPFPKHRPPPPPYCSSPQYCTSPKYCTPPHPPNTASLPILQLSALYTFTPNTTPPLFYTYPPCHM